MPALGPIAAAKVPLTPGRSLAVDRLLHTFGTPFYIDAPSLTAFGGKPFRRLMIAQDTGSSITGPARGDLFAGSGDAAGEVAGVVRSAADFYALVPRALAGRSRRMTRAGGKLSDEDRIIWTKVARTAQPLKGKPPLPADEPQAGRLRHAGNAVGRSAGRCLRKRRRNAPSARPSQARIRSTSRPATSSPRAACRSMPASTCTA